MNCVRKSAVLCVSALSLLAAGCGAPTPDPDNMQSSQLSYDDAVNAFAAKDFAAAEAGLTSSIDGGGLNPDLLAEAFMMRATARIELGEYDGALSDLDELAPVAPDPAELHRMRGDVHLAQGDKVAAKEAYTAARKLNPKIRMPRGL